MQTRFQTDISFVARRLQPVRSLVSVHVAIRCESLAAEDTREGTLTRVDEHVAIEGGEGGEHLSTEATVVDLGLACWVRRIRRWFNLVMTPEVRREILLAREDMAAYRTLVIALQHRHILIFREHLGTKAT